MSETFSTKSFIVAENLGKAFTRAGLTETTFWPLRGVSMSLYAGELATLRGRSGAGKSTLIHGLLGLLKMDEGAVKLLGHTLSELDDEALSLLRNQHVGYVCLLYTSDAADE